LPLGWIALAYAAAGITRLVYFTLDKNPIPGFFKGLPSPAGALLVVAPLIMLNQAAGGGLGLLRFWSLFCVGTMLFAAVWMNIYPLRYLHFGRLMNRRPLFVSLWLVLALLLVFTPYFGYFTLGCMILYLVSPLWTWRISPEIAASEKRIPKGRPKR
jgi:phosphatidylserine synthase